MIGVYLWTSFVFLRMLIVDAKVSQGWLYTSYEFSYLDRFCFQSDTGQLEYRLTYPTRYNVHNLLLYYDSDDQWPTAYKTLTTCRDRVELLHNRSENNQIIRLDAYDSFGDQTTKCRLLSDNISGEEYVQCSGTRSFHSMRSRWWFLAVSVCEDEPTNNTQGIHIDFRLVMTNGEPGQFLRYQFSDDEWLILPTNFGFLIIQIILLLTSCFVGCNLSSRRLYHHAYRIATQSFWMETVGLAGSVTSYIIYANDGMGMPIIKFGSHILRAIGQMLFVISILLLSRGLNVVKMRLSLVEKLLLSMLSTVFITAYIGMIFWEEKVFDPALVYYRSESLPGYLLASWKLIAWLFFIVSSMITWNDHPVKRRFYMAFMVLYTPWFFAGPIVLGIANYVLNNWVREGVVNIVDNCVITYGYIIFLYISWPSSANLNFPFHIRTSQINCDFDPHTNYAAKTEGNNEEVQMSRMPQITTNHDEGSTTPVRYTGQK